MKTKKEIIEPIFEFKAFKPAYNLSEETIAFTANLYHKGKHVATCQNNGQGECNAIYWKDKRVEQLLTDYLESLPEIPFSFDPSRTYKIGEDSFISTLVNRYGARHELKKMCKGKTCLRLPEHDKDTYITYNVAMSDAKGQAYIRTQHAEFECLNHQLKIPVNSKGFHLED